MHGIFAIAAGVASYGYLGRWWALLLEGVTGIVIGLLVFYWPDVTTLVLLYFITVRMVTTGTLEIVAAIEFRQVFPREWTMMIGGLLSVNLGILLSIFPAMGIVSLAWLISLYAYRTCCVSWKWRLYLAHDAHERRPLFFSVPRSITVFALTIRTRD